MKSYIRFNGNRKEEFNAITLFDNDNSVVVKRASSEKAELFVKSLAQKYDYLSSFELPFKIVSVEIKNGEAHFPFVSGTTLRRKIVSALEKKDVEGAIKWIQFYETNILDKLPSTDRLPEGELAEFFKDSDNTDEYVLPGVVDLTFDNLILGEDEQTMTLIDYEWVWESSVPKKFLEFKAMSGLLNYLGQRKVDFTPLKEYYNSVFEDRYVVYEYNLQTYVCTDVSGFSSFKKPYTDMKRFKPARVSGPLDKYSAILERLDFLEDENVSLKSHVDQNLKTIGYHQSLLNFLPIKIFVYLLQNFTNKYRNK